MVRWSVSLLVLVTAAQMTAQEVRSLPPREKRFAVIVGVDRYDDGQISPLFAAASDARKLRDTLVVSCSFPREQVHVLATGELKERQPTRENIMATIADVLRAAPVDGLFLFAFAGHGKEGRDREAFLFPSNVRMNVLEDTALPLSWIHARIRDVRIEQVVLLLDHCRNDPGGRADVPNPLTEAFIEATRFDKRNDGVIAYATIYASSLGERAYEDNDNRQGYFSAAVIEALSRASGEVTLGRLIEHVQTTVPGRVKKERRAEQHPYDIVEGYRAESLVLANAAPVLSAPPGIISSEDELETWQHALALNTPEAFEAYIRKHPYGSFVQQARISIQAHRTDEPYSVKAARDASDSGRFKEARRLFQKGVTSSDPEALAELGKLSLLCLGGPCDFADSAYFLERAIKGGHREAEGWLAFQWVQLGGNRARAIDYARSSADRGELSGRVALAQAYDLGVGVEEDKSEADRYYRLAAPELQERAKAQDPWAMNILGKMYMEGRGGFSRDNARAIELIRVAADKNYPTAQRNLAIMRQTGFGGLRKDPQLALQLLRSAAALRHPGGQYQLALAYMYGMGVPNDDMKAVELLREALDAGLAMARTALGYMYEMGRGGLQKNDVKAAELYRQAADDNDAQAQYYLAMMYATGRGGLPEDEGRAAELYQQASETHAGAQNALGAMYEAGRGGLARDDVQAVTFYRRAAAADYLPAQLNLARMYHYGRGGLQRDPIKTAELYQVAAEQGDATAQVRLAGMYLRGDGVAADEANAAKLLHAAADQGETSAMAVLADMYASGRGGLPQDTRMAAQFYEKAANQGIAAAQNSLGLMYLNGAGGLAKDQPKALILFHKAAEQGWAPAQTNIGFMYERGIGGLIQDYQKAAELYRLASERGDLTATANLAIMYEKGRGVPQDLGQAIELYRKASAGGNIVAKQALVRLQQ